MRRPSPVTNKRRRATRQRYMFMTESLDLTPKTTEQNLIVRSAEAKIANSARGYYVDIARPVKVKVWTLVIAPLT